MKKITDPGFKYTPSFATDLRKKFRKMQQDRRAAEAQAANVTPLEEARAKKAGK